MTLNNLLNTLAFGSVIKSNGKPYTAILRLTDRLFVAMEQNAELPAPLMLVQVDILMGPGADPGSGQQTGPGPGPAGPGPGAGDPPTQPPDGDKKETVH